MMNTDEKRGGRPQPYRLLQGFTEVIRECGLTDLGFVGEKYTWEKSRGSSNWIQERLDRGLASQAWCNMFPRAEVQVLEVATSDHLPLLLKLNKQIYRRKERRFRFENSWLREKDCEMVIKNGWMEANQLELMAKIKFCGLKLQEWGGGISMEYKKQGQDLRHKLRKLRSRRDSQGINKYNEVRWEYLTLLEKHEIHWKQRAKNFWLREGDCNTRFFHRFASGRRKNNGFQRIKNANGVWQETTEKIHGVIEEYFS